MDKNKRWKEVTALFLVSVAVFGIAEDSQNTEKIFNEMQEQILDTEMQEELAQTNINSEEIAEQETESENASEQETENVKIDYEELQCIRRSDKYGYVDEIGRTVLPFVYDDAAPYMEGLAYFRIGEDYGFMDETQTPVFYLDCDSVSNFGDGFAYISIDARYGYIDRSGEIVIEPVYHDADNFQDGYAVIMKNGKFGVIDKTGKEVVEPKYKNIDRGGENFVVQENEKYQIVNREGQNLLKSSCEEIFNYDYPVVGFRDREQEICGCVEGENIVYFEEDYEWMFFIPQRDLVILKKDETYGIKDFQGNIVIPFEYQHISYNSYYDTYHIMDQKGEESEIDADDFTGKKDGIVLEEIYPKSGYNKLTPRGSKYLDFLKHGKFVVNDINLTMPDRKEGQ